VFFSLLTNTIQHNHMILVSYTPSQFFAAEERKKSS